MEFTQAENHVNWSTTRKNVVRDSAGRMGPLDLEPVKVRVLATAGVVGFFAFMIGAVELVESINL